MTAIWTHDRNDGFMILLHLLQKLWGFKLKSWSEWMNCASDKHKCTEAALTCTQTLFSEKQKNRAPVWRLMHQNNALSRDTQRARADLSFLTDALNWIWCFKDSSELKLTNQQRRDLPEPKLTDTHENTTYITRIHLKSREYTSNHENTPHITRIHLTRIHLTSREYTSNHKNTPHENTPHITRIHHTSREYTTNHENTPHIMRIHHENTLQITRIHLKSREYTSNHENTPHIMRIHHENTLQITRIHHTSREYTSNHENTPQITRIHHKSREYT